MSPESSDVADWLRVCKLLVERTDAHSLMQVRTSSAHLTCTIANREGGSRSWSLSASAAGEALRAALAPATGGGPVVLWFAEVLQGPAWELVAHELRDHTPALLVGADSSQVSPEQLGEALSSLGLPVTFVGRSPPGTDGASRPAALVIRGFTGVRAAPPDFKILAIVTAYNEEDVIRATARYLLNQGIQVHLVDNWSQDRTRAQVQDLVGQGLTVQQFPPSGRSDSYDWTGLLGNVEQVALASGADWVIHHDSDEVRESPWPGTSLRDAIYTVDQLGWTAIDHTCLEFRAIDDAYPPGVSLRDYFFHFEFARSDRVNAWRQKAGVPVDLRSSGGHQVRFPGMQVFPVNFFMRHVSIRSQAHGERKVYRDRQPRYPVAELLKGWHRHYADVRPHQDFLRDPTTLLRFHESTFYETYLFERLARTGIPESPSNESGTLKLRIVRALRAWGLGNLIEHAQILKLGWRARRR